MSTYHRVKHDTLHFQDGFFFNAVFLKRRKKKEVGKVGPFGNVPKCRSYLPVILLYGVNNATVLCGFPTISELLFSSLGSFRSTQRGFHVIPKLITFLSV